MTSPKPTVDITGSERGRVPQFVKNAQAKKDNHQAKEARGFLSCPSARKPQGRARLADCTDESIAALLKLAISGLEKSLQGLPVTGYEHFGFRMTFIRYLRGDDTMWTPKGARPSLEELRAKRGP